MAASVARRRHQQALWAILALALPLFLPTTLGGASFLLSTGHKIDPEGPGWREWNWRGAHKGTVWGRWQRPVP